MTALTERIFNTAVVDAFALKLKGLAIVDVDLLDATRVTVGSAEATADMENADIFTRVPERRARVCGDDAETPSTPTLARGRAPRRGPRARDGCPDGDSSRVVTRECDTDGRFG